MRRFRVGRLTLRPKKKKAVPQRVRNLSRVHEKWNTHITQDCLISLTPFCSFGSQFAAHWRFLGFDLHYRTVGPIFCCRARSDTDEAISTVFFLPRRTSAAGTCRRSWRTPYVISCVISVSGIVSDWVVSSFTMHMTLLLYFRVNSWGWFVCLLVA